MGRAQNAPWLGGPLGGPAVPETSGAERAGETRAGTGTGRSSKVEKIFTMQGLLLKGHCFKETSNVFMPCKELEFQDFVRIRTFV